jgi:hypothetical protein
MMNKALEICRQSLAQAEAMLPRLIVQIEQQTMQVQQSQAQKQQVEADIALAQVYALVAPDNAGIAAIQESIDAGAVLDAQNVRAV